MDAKRRTSERRRGHGSRLRELDAQVAELRDAVANASRGNRAQLRRALAACLNSRGTERAQHAVAALVPDEATRQRIASARAWDFFSGTTSSTVRGRGRGRLGLGRRPRIDWGEVAGMALKLALVTSPFWVPALLVYWGVISEETANVVYVLAIVLWVLLVLIGWLTDWYSKSVKPMLRGQYVGAPTEPAMPCDVRGCSNPSSYQVRLDSPYEEFMATTEPTYKRVCSVHRTALEHVMNQPIVDDDALAELLDARSDLKEAARLAPRERTIRENLRRVDDALAQVRDMGVHTG